MTRANDKASEINESSQNSAGSGINAADFQLGRLMDDSLMAAKQTAAIEFGKVSIEDNGQTCAS